jgi:hypothetical protein
MRRQERPRGNVVRCFRAVMARIAMLHQARIA